jgi:hypothetical protein
MKCVSPSVLRGAWLQMNLPYEMCEWHEMSMLSWRYGSEICIPKKYQPEFISSDGSIPDILIFLYIRPPRLPARSDNPRQRKFYCPFDVYRTVKIALQGWNCSAVPFTASKTDLSRVPSRVRPPASPPATSPAASAASTRPSATSTSGSLHHTLLSSV